MVVVKEERLFFYDLPMLISQSSAPPQTWDRVKKLKRINKYSRKRKRYDVEEFRLPFEAASLDDDEMIT